MSKRAQSNASATKIRNFDTTLNGIKREFGEGAIMYLGDRAVQKVPAISTGSLALDLATGIGGVPRGRIVEIFGPESSGKTTVCLHVIANAQKAGGTAAFIDTEHALDAGYARTIGVQADELLVAQPDCGEDALGIADALVSSNAVDVVIVDSVAALTPRAELAGEMGDSHVGLQARLMSQALRKLTAKVAHSNTCLIFTNQLREKIGVMFGNPETTTGGNAMKFYASLRLSIRKREVLKNSMQEPVGHRTKVKIVKNKLAPPFREVEFDIMYDGTGISRVGSILDVALTHGIVEKRGSWFQYNGTALGQGVEKAKALLADDTTLCDEILTAVRARLETDSNSTAPIVLDSPKDASATA